MESYEMDPRSGYEGCKFGDQILRFEDDRARSVAPGTLETPYTVDYVKALATHAYSESDQGAAISSGSFITAGMIIVPCSVRTLAAIAHGQGDNLIHRAADVILKERRKLVLMVREAPLNDIHLENMLKLSRMGVVISPPVPAFYNHPQTLESMIDHIVMRALDQFGIHIDAAARWDGIMTTGGTPRRERQ